MKIKKSVKKLISVVLILVFCVGVVAPTFVTAQTTTSATDTDRLSAALLSYRDFLLATTHTVDTWFASNIPWRVGDIIEGKLVDFDNDGIPEMVIVIDTATLGRTAPGDTSPGGRRIFPILVIGYRGRAEIIYEGLIYASGAAAMDYGIAREAAGQTYLVGISSCAAMETAERTYYTLTRGQWTRVRSTFSESDPAAFRDALRMRGPVGAGQTLLSQINNMLSQPTAPPINVLLDGTPLTFDVPPQIINGRTMVPLRAIFEALGAEVDWNEATQTVTGTKGDTTVVLPIGSTTPTINGQTVTIDVPGVVIDGRTLVPLRFVAESFGVSVDWDADTRTVTINSAA